MKKMTISIAICTVLSLTACGQTGDTESSNQTTANEPTTEQNTSSLAEQQADQSAETGIGTETQTEQAAFEAGDAVNDQGEMIEDTNNN
jgi:predicted small lipoprotein YifL